MGLDQYANSRTSNGEVSELATWRKHNRLQGWMETLWTIKTGKPAEDLNCNELELTMEDLQQLKKCILHKTLPKTQGFFYGSDSYERETDEKDLEFISKACQAIEEGEEVIYSCWW